MIKVLVSGADGFIGSHLVEMLVEEGFDVWAFVYYNSFNSWGWLDTLTPMQLERIEVFAGAIRDPNGVRKAKIADCVMEAGLHVPFMRPAQFATDTATSEEVIRHALGWYAAQGRSFDWVVLLQSTSPLRTGRHIQDALSLIGDDVDMVVSVFETDANPYYVLVEPDKGGYLTPSKQGAFTRRQDCPVVYQLNGASYVIRVDSLGQSPKTSLAGFLMLWTGPTVWTLTRLLTSKWRSYSWLNATKGHHPITMVLTNNRAQ